MRGQETRAAEARAGEAALLRGSKAEPERRECLRLLHAVVVAAVVVLGALEARGRVHFEPAERELLRLETVLQERLLGGWNQVACSMRGLGAPPALTPGFADRADAWAPEAQSAAREWLARLEASGRDEGD